MSSYASSLFPVAKLSQEIQLERHAGVSLEHRERLVVTRGGLPSTVAGAPSLGSHCKPIRWPADSGMSSEKPTLSSPET